MLMNAFFMSASLPVLRNSGYFPAEQLAEKGKFIQNCFWNDQFMHSKMRHWFMQGWSLPDFYLTLVALLGLALGSVILYVTFRRIKNKKKQQSRKLLFAKTFNRILDGERETLLEDLLETYRELDHDISIGLALGALYRHMGKLQMALRMHRTVLTDDSLTPELRARIQTELANDFLASGLLERAQTEIEKAISSGFFFSETRTSAVRIFMALKQWDKAAKYAGKGLPRNEAKIAASQIRTEQAEWFIGNEDWKEAKSSAKKAISLDSKNATALLALARVYLKQHKNETVRKLLGDCTSTLGDQAWRGFATLKDVAIQMNDHDWFLRSLEIHLDLFPEDWRSKSVLASFLARIGEKDRAGQLLLECLSMAPDALYLHQKIWKLLLKKPLQVEIMEKYAELMKDVLPIRNPYVCHACGITATQYHWQCPSCHQFGSYKERTL